MWTIEVPNWAPTCVRILSLFEGCLFTHWVFTPFTSVLAGKVIGNTSPPPPLFYYWHVPTPLVVWHRALNFWTSGRSSLDSVLKAQSPLFFLCGLVSIHPGFHFRQEGKPDIFFFAVLLVLKYVKAP